MSIDWKKAHQDLNKTQKVKSKFLVDLKERVEFLEMNLTQTKSDLKLMSEQFHNAEKANLSLITENENLTNKIGEKDRLISELRKVENDLTFKIETLSLENEGIKKESEQLKKQFETEIIDLTSRYESKINEMKLNKKQREDTLETLRHDFQIYSENSENLRNENTKLKEEILKLNAQVSEKAAIISTLNEKVKESDNNKLDNFEKFGEHRIMCPSCHSTGSDIKEIEDRKKILDYYDHKPIFAKKYVCKKCGNDFN